MNWSNILELARLHHNDDVRELALKASSWTEGDRTAVLQQVVGRRIARDKLPQWAQLDDIVYGPQLTMEQCSSQATALYKAALVHGSSITDLTGGLGVDFSFMSQGRVGTYVERQEHLCDIVRHNFAVLGLDARVINGDAVDYLNTMREVDTIYIDPARRDKAGNRVFALNDCTPNVVLLAPTLLAKAHTVIIKLSPMLDHRSAVAALPCVQQVHIVGTRNECKELLLVLKRDYCGPVTVHCAHDDHVMCFVLGEENFNASVWNETCVPRYLYEPNATIMKAGAYNLLAHRKGLVAVSAHSHLLMGDTFIDDFAGRTFEVEAVSTMNKKELKAFMQGIDKANVAVRNFPLRAPELAKRLRVHDGGATYIFGTTTASLRHLLFRCHQLASTPLPPFGC